MDSRPNPVERIEVNPYGISRQFEKSADREVGLTSRGQAGSSRGMTSNYENPIVEYGNDASGGLDVIYEDEG